MPPRRQTLLSRFPTRGGWGALRPPLAFSVAAYTPRGDNNNVSIATYSTGKKRDNRDNCK